MIKKLQIFAKNLFICFCPAILGHPCELLQTKIHLARAERTFSIEKIVHDLVFSGKCLIIDNFKEKQLNFVQRALDYRLFHINVKLCEFTEKTTDGREFSETNF